MWLHSVMMTLNFCVSNSFLLPRYRTSWTVEKFTKQISRFFGRSGNRVMIYAFFELSTAFCIQAVKSFDEM